KSAIIATPLDQPLRAQPVASPQLTPEQKIAAEEARLAARVEREEAFVQKDKDLINSILKKIMRIIESNRDGTARIMLAAYDLKKLIENHKDENRFPIGSPQKEEALKNLKDTVKMHLSTLAKQPAYQISEEDISSTLNGLSRDKVNPAVVQLLRDYY